MFVSYLTPPQWLNLILGLLHLVNPQIWGLKKKFNCSLQQPTEILRDKEYLRWFFDLCFVFVTRGWGLRKITMVGDHLCDRALKEQFIMNKLHLYFYNKIKIFHFRLKSSSMNWFEIELCIFYMFQLLYHIISRIQIELRILLIIFFL